MFHPLALEHKINFNSYLCRYGMKGKVENKKKKEKIGKIEKEEGEKRWKRINIREKEE